ncbi:MAG TPA: response regulator [Methanospirillum sp.]|nr:response regulator [Methanospirillum sp.]
MNIRTILLVDDDIVDVMTVKRALKDLKSSDKVDVAHNGEEALEYLQKSHGDPPGYILLDLNMPRMNGLEFLALIKQDPDLRRIPVVVLTTSMADTDRRAAFDLGVSGYVVKPVDYSHFVGVMQTIQDYWKISERG